jgi:predicted acylesterase/phospholipase RssA
MLLQLTRWCAVGGALVTWSDPVARHFRLRLPSALRCCARRCGAGGDGRQHAGHPLLGRWRSGRVTQNGQRGQRRPRGREGLSRIYRAQGTVAAGVLLAISGGGENGAFGAGLLVGWTAAGARPVFKGVTGISTGALTAPFAFLGSAYDDKLREVYTTITGKDVLESRGIYGVLFQDSMADNAPLRKTVAKYVDQAMLDAIGKESKKGRILLIGTTNLDAMRPVIWNIGAIANSGQPDRLKLVQDILVASAAIPGAFPR